MASRLHGDIEKYYEEHRRYSFLELEHALIHAILQHAGIKKVRNKRIKTFLATIPRQSLLDWIHKEIPSPTLQHALTLYELRVSPKGRKTDGAFYTPQKIVDDVVDLTLERGIGTVCDPACGSGAFLLGAVKRLQKNGAGTIPHILSNYIWGVDIDTENVTHAKKILSLFAVLNGADKEDLPLNIFPGNTLTFSWKSTPRKKADFTYVVGNPPYVRGRNLTAQLKKEIKAWPSAGAGIADLYIPFFEIGLSWAHPTKGRLGYITPNTYFSSVNARKLRELLVKERVIETIIDFDGFSAFEGLLTYTCITILTNAKTTSVDIGVAARASQVHDIRRIKLSRVGYEALGKGEWYIRPSRMVKHLRGIETIGTALDNYVPRFATGIATLKNNLYIFNTPLKGNYLHILRDGLTFRIEKNITVPIIKPNKIKTYEQLRRNQERVLYPYRMEKGKPSVIPEKEVKKKFPGAYAYLTHIRPLLAKRSSDTKVWYAYGRSQALDGFGKKIIFPMMSDKPVFLRVDDPHTLIYCGYALYPGSEQKTKVLLKILTSHFFWHYLSTTSKNYSGGYKSLAKNYVKRFTIPHLSPTEEKKLLSLSGTRLESFLKEKYRA